MAPILNRTGIARVHADDQLRECVQGAGEPPLPWDDFLSHLQLWEIVPCTFIDWGLKGSPGTACCQLWQDIALTWKKKNAFSNWLVQYFCNLVTQQGNHFAICSKTCFGLVYGLTHFPIFLIRNPRTSPPSMSCVTPNCCIWVTFLHSLPWNKTVLRCLPFFPLPPL